MRYPTRASEPAHRRLRSRLLLCTIHQCKNFTMCPRGDGKPCAVYLTGDIRMGWSGRVPALPAANAGRGHQRQGARHVTEARHFARRSRHRYRQELVPHRWPESARCYRAAAEVVAWPGRGSTGQSAAVSDRIVAGLERMTGNATPPRNTYDLKAVDTF